MLESILIAATVLATFANITVPVIPDPEYLKSLNLPNTVAPQVATPTSAISAQTITDAIPYVISIATGLLLKQEHSKNEKRQKEAANTIVKLAENDESTDKGTLDLVYADNVLIDILSQDPIWKQRLDEYKTKYGTTGTQFFKDMTRNFNEDFKSYYETNKITLTSKDTVVNTLRKVQDKVTPA